MSDAVPEGIAADRVTDWFTSEIPGAVAPFTFSLIAGGHSNLTYKVDAADGSTFVLRRPPLGHVLESAHDMAREHRIISAVGRTDVPVPATLGLCEDTEVNEAPFYVMAYVDGEVLHGEEEGQLVPDAERAPLSDDVIDVLAALHLVEPDDIGLGELGRREDYIGRQLRRWTKQWEGSKTRELPEMDEIQRLLERDQPEQVGASIVHGDYRLGNMLSRTGRVLAVLDWELCTLGDPLADVGYLMNNWIAPGEELAGAGSSAPTLAGGFADRDHLLERYAAATGRDVSRVPYYRAFSYWRLAAIVEGVLNRYLKGVMGDGDGIDTDEYKVRVEDLAGAALELLS